MIEFKAGDRVRLKKDPTAVGKIDEVYEENGAKMTSVVWDISGCVGDGPIEEIGRAHV